MSFGYALRRFREERNLSLRELSKLCEIDHAYIYRLEKDEKTSPSDDVVDTLVRTLKLSAYRAKLLRSLVGMQANPQLIDLFINDEDQPLDLLAPLAQMSFRGKRPVTHDDWRIKAEQLSKLMNDEVD